MRTTSSTFITRLQSIEGLNKTLSSKQGEVTFLFYNTGKAFLWVEVGNKAKVRPTLLGCVGGCMILSGTTHED
jgi:hypothetical protein